MGISCGVRTVFVAGLLDGIQGDGRRFSYGCSTTAMTAVEYGGDGGSISENFFV